MSDPATHNLVDTDPDRFKIVAFLGGQLAGGLNDLPPHLRMEVLVYTVASVFMDVKPVKGFTRLTAFDEYMRAARETIAKNMALEGFEKEQANGVR